jgi:hypothetical protein
VTLQGILPTETSVLSEISEEQVIKLAKGNDVCALVVVVATNNDASAQEKYLIRGIPKEVQEVIHDNYDLFVVPTSLPPNRVFDHDISLYPESLPVNCKPYRYSPQQKDEIEK